MIHAWNDQYFGKKQETGRQRCRRDCRMRQKASCEQKCTQNQKRHPEMRKLHPRRCRTTDRFTKQNQNDGDDNPRPPGTNLSREGQAERGDRKRHDLRRKSEMPTEHEKKPCCGHSPLAQMKRGESTGQQKHCGPSRHVVPEDHVVPRHCRKEWQRYSQRSNGQARG